MTTRVHRPEESSGPSAFVTLYDGWYDHVYRWVRAQGCPDGDIEDVTQDVFVIVQRNLARFDGQNEAAWLYSITRRTVRDYRRRSWFKHVFLRPRDVDLDAVRSHAKTPIELLEGKEERALVRDAIAKMSPKWRTAFVLFELEGYSGEEIARFQGVPLATIWTHLHRGRKEFTVLVTGREGEAS